MFDRLKKGFKGLVTKVTMAELKPENLRPVLADFKMSLVENDVAFPVADHVCEELEKRLNAYHENPQAGSPWNTVKERILARN